MNDFKNTAELYKWLLSGGKIRNKRNKDQVLFLKDDGNLSVTYSDSEFYNWEKVI